MQRRRPKYTPAQIRAIREAVELTQQEFAAKVGVTVSTISKWEQGTRTPERYTEPLLDKFVKAHGLDLDVLRESA